MELQRAVLLLVVVQPAELVERSERERRRLTAGDGVIGADLVVAVAQRVLRLQHGEQRTRVRIARRHRDRAAAAVPRRRHDAARIVDGDVCRRAHAIRGRRGRARRHDARHEAAVVRRVGARVEVDAAHQVRVDHRRAEREMEQRGDAHAVQVEAGVAGIRAAHDVDRGRPHDLRHAGQRADDAHRIARRAGHRARLVGADLDARDLGAAGAHGGLEALAAQPRRQPEQHLAVGGAAAHLDALGGVVVTGQVDLQVVRAGRDAQREAAVLVGLGGGGAVDDDRHAGQRAARPFLQHAPAHRHGDEGRRQRRCRLRVAGRAVAGNGDGVAACVIACIRPRRVGGRRVLRRARIGARVGAGVAGQHQQHRGGDTRHRDRSAAPSMVASHSPSCGDGLRPRTTYTTRTARSAGSGRVAPWSGDA